ncbi:BTB/POZ and MATH domain-containing protein 2 [Rhynchospora pubera]|uniref:BTB/POZ and MATH domain-containing protein 2 n=1 Tax=Rhynchospora pubera TaxID=906938 RepID=A0AAV8DQC9_9POAL|nr:BTB/POZ and MATH domain-containing protein 2 [Rhynchospora pubera]
MGYSLEKDIGKGKFLESGTFNVGGYDWSIKYYPNGHSTAENDYASVFIYLKSDEAQNVKAQPSFAILNQNGDLLLKQLTAGVNNFDKKNDGFGFPNFQRRSAFESHIKDDCFVIRCIVTVFKVFPVQVEPAVPLPVPAADKQQLSYLLEAGYGADVTFEVKGQTFNAHKCILAMRSQVFRAQFFGPLKEKSDAIIKIEDMDAPVFEPLLRFIYSETIPEFEEENGSEKKHNTEFAQHLLAAADRYDLERLKKICENILYGSIEKNNVIPLWSLAERHNCTHLKTACLKYIIYIAPPEILSEVIYEA